MSPEKTRVTANPEQWAQSQRYELDYWKNSWPYRGLPIGELQTLRHKDAEWLMSSLGFSGGPGRSFEGFAGSVLEIGCGPLGFFELTENVDVLASDSLMDLYAAEIPYSTLGRRGSTNYVATPLQAIEQRFRFVVCSNVLDHSADWLEFLELLVNRVGPGGELLLVSDTRGYPMEGHTQVFSPEQAVRALRWLGLNRVLFRKDARAFNDHCDTRLFLRVAR